MTNKATRRFNRLCLATLIAVYFLILVGGVVRATGSGMGCPDWPKCFGHWIPPTSQDQLPTDYKEQYASYRDKKNGKFARYLSAIGLSEAAERLRNDPAVRTETEFNASKTWVEYLNRVVGVVIGLMIIALFITSWTVRKESRGIYFGSLLLLGLVIFQGWFGSIVVSTNLTAWTITVHMFLAVVMVWMLIWLLVRSGNSAPLAPRAMRTWLLAGIMTLLVQIFLGTQVRETLDRLAAVAERGDWIGRAGSAFVIHRSFSWAIILILAAISYKLRKTTKENALYLVPILLVLCSLLTGAAMAYFGVPPAMQPVHLLVAIVTVGWLFQVYLQAKDKPISLSN